MPNVRIDPQTWLPEAIQWHLDEFLDDRECRVLEAGCGSASHFRLPPSARIVGIDISKAQLDRHKGLTEKILGDIQTYDLGTGIYDLVVCTFVLEHVRYPRKAMERFVRSLKRNGLILVVVPDLMSLAGLVAKYTPHFVHVLFYRWFLGKANAGRSSTGPFPTFHSWDIAPNRLLEFFHLNDCKVVFQCAWSERYKHIKARSHFWAVIYLFLAKSLSVVSMGRLGGVSRGAFVILARKNS